MQTLRLLRAKVEGTTFLGGGVARLRERDQLWVIPIAALGIVVGAGGLVWMLYQNYRGMAMLGLGMGIPDLPLYLATIATWVVVFVLGFPVAISVFYFSKDTRLLASLPVRSFSIVSANVGLVYLYALPVAVLFFVPALAASCGATGSLALGGAAHLWSVGALTILVLPVVPLVVAVLLVTILTRLVNLSRFRTGLEAMGMMMIVVVLVGVQLLLSRTLAESGGEVTITQAMQSMLARIAGAVPPARWYSRAFLVASSSAAAGPGLLLVTVPGTVAVGFAALAAVQRGYLRQLANQATTATGRRRATPEAMPKQHSPVRSLVVRELKLLTSNSTFLFESVGEVFVFPLILLIVRLSTPAEALDQVLPFLDQTAYLLPIVVGVLVLLAGINSVSSAALSREGKSFDLSLSLPVAGSTQLAAKVLTYLVLFGGAFALNAVLLTWIIGRPWWYALVIAVCGIPFVWLIGVTTIYADLRRPVLVWNHPQQAVKQNMNVLVGMGIAIVAVVVTAAPAVVAALRGAGQGLVIVLGSGFALLAAAVIRRMVYRYADHRYGSAFSR